MQSQIFHYPAKDAVIKLHQTGDQTISNRLVDEADSLQGSRERSNALDSGHRACQGCGEALGARHAIDTALDATDGELVVVNATGCLEVFSTPYPQSAWRLPWVHSLFGNAAAVASGVAQAMKMQGKENVRVIAQGGDGGTTDIGMGCLSGMFERNEDVLYICYNNEAYMNTGVQRSSQTPGGARTATTMPVGEHPGNNFGTGKSVPKIAMAHNIPYVATANIANPRDLEAKVRKAMSIRGARYIEVFVPCPLGWGTASSDTIKVARLAMNCGLTPLYEAEYGQITQVTKLANVQPVNDYLKIQRRFAHMFQPGNEHQLQSIQAIADANVRAFDLLSSSNEGEE
ncbi:thiamine pyrophosphate-dependent enzyme [Parendozoicomonas haliclonae]|uniref:Pyruvate synthase subunit PorB n=1 Tax=Parendozoicomonas haliclonae TaxID=1960125 RepID=A0A1X7ANB6_9GAMM|nr:thiamine pyrophosphate-dependent enzyme [Parendozoicomonas haliclonae]SMA49811.1 Pyruvate synthase subunit PorB [Parendozoicomonas haliclonae]